MKRKRTYWSAFLLLPVISCSNPEKALVGDWEMHALGEQTYYDKAIKSFSSDDVVKQYLMENGNTALLNEYDGYSRSDKEELKQTLAKELDLQGQKAWSKLEDGGFISLYENRTFSFYFYPHYFTGKYVLIDETNIYFSISEISSTVSYKTPLQKKATNFNLEFNTKDKRSFFTVQSKGFPSIWELDTLFVRKRKKQWSSRKPENNAWRFEIESPRDRLKSHVQYLITVFEDALKNGLGRVDINSEFNCSPLKFYGNRVAIRDLNDAKLDCWRGLFQTKRQFHESYVLLSNILDKIEPTPDKNRFRTAIHFLTNLKDSL